MTPSCSRAAAFAAALALVGSSAATADVAHVATSPPPARVPAVDFSDIATRAAPAVVAIRVRQVTAPEVPEGFPEHLVERLREGGEMRHRTSQALGSGFFVSQKGHIVTNHHVVEAAIAVDVTLADGTAHRAEVVGTDPQTDLAVLQIPLAADGGEALTAVPWGDSDALLPGAWTIAVGSPFGLGGSVTVGVLSARQRDMDTGSHENFLQTDAAINVGNSGGPLFNIHGEVVGVNTAIYSPTGASVGIGFAVPSRIAEPVIRELIETGRVRRGFIGLSAQDLDPALARAFDFQQTAGALVAHIEAGSPAARVGLRRGDLVTSLDGEEIASARDLTSVVAARAPGDRVRLGFVRNGNQAHEVLVEVRLHEPPSSRPATAHHQTDDRLRLGLSLRALPDYLRPAGIEHGVLVARVRPGGLGEEMGLRPGDLILEAGNRPVYAPGDVTAAWHQARAAAAPLLLHVERAGAPRFIAIDG